MFGKTNGCQPDQRLVGTSKQNNVCAYLHSKRVDLFMICIIVTSQDTEKIDYWVIAKIVT